MKLYEGNERTLPYILEDKARTAGSKVFVRYKDEAVTYEELNKRSNQIANTLIKEINVNKGDKIAVMLPNCADYVVVQFGIAKSGGVQVPVSTQSTGDMLAHMLNISGAEILIIDSQFLHLLLPIRNKLEYLKKIIIYPQRDGEGPKIGREYEAISYEDLFKGETSSPQIVVSRSDPVDIFFTSGTTGVSKGVVLPHNHHYHFGAVIAQWARMGGEDCFYICLPFYHGVTQYMSVMPAMLAEGSIAIVERFSASKYWDDLRKYNATVSWAVYTMPSVLMKQPEMEDDGDNPMRVLCTIGIAPDLVEPFEKRFGVKVLDMYGSTEQEAIAFTPYEEKRYGAVGPVNDKHFDVRIFDANDEELPPGEIGEIVSRPKEPYTQMMEYCNMPRETLRMFRNLWLHSGDLGYIKDSWLYFIGRDKDAIRRRGENISSFEVERLVLHSDAVEECAAIPVSTELGEDDIKVVVVPKAGHSVAPQQLLAFCKNSMAKYMVPRYIEVRERLPKTPTEKIEKVRLKEEGVTLDTWDAEEGDYVRNLARRLKEH
ncbi:MAG: AMP-binding protein [Chloroflexi bacterium]|nr:AMP-binding protein [Chloroflexota bacterium]